MTNFESIDTDLLPGRISDLVDVIGLKATLVIVELRGGVRLSVPKNPSSDHWLAVHIGLDALIKLSKIYGGETIEIDRCAAAIRATLEARIVREHETGASNSTLARRYNYTERGIRKLRRRVERRQPSPNYDLFDED